MEGREGDCEARDSWTKQEKVGKDYRGDFIEKGKTASKNVGLYDSDLGQTRGMGEAQGHCTGTFVLAKKP